ncbi:MAG: 3-oxoacyl-ACP reductase FabG [Clostridia bacterium]|nr:3-oxoacyl-ACP reductase FabG [Clostridia bacterium]
MRNVLITGASRGIGEATARLFAKNGDKVYINYRTEKGKAEKIAEEIGGVAVYADISNSSQVKEMLDKIPDIDVLVNNAGFAQFQFFDALSDEDWYRMMDVTLSGAFYCIRGVLQSMIHKKSGSIINVSSIWGITGSACEVAYSTAKAGLIGMTKALAKEVGLSGITVNCVAPGIVDTEMNKNLSCETIKELCEETPLGRLATPEEIAKTIYFLAEPDTFITGQIISPNGGFVI